MTLQQHYWLLCLCIIVCAAGANAGASESAESCALEFRIPLALRGFANAQLVGGVAPGLRIVDSVGGLLWSGGATGATTQRFADMTAGFNSSLAVVDTNGDGNHDRIYAGDVQGRLWRFDLDTSAPAAQWVAGGIFADMGDDTNGRGFLAAPDVTLITPIGTLPWLSIAIGTAITFPALTAQPIELVRHRFYVLRDRAPFERWTQPQYDQWTPLAERDLAPAEGQRLAVSGVSGVGFYVNLGGDQVLAPALTLNGNTIFTMAHTRASFLPSCVVHAATPAPVQVSVSSISTLDGSRVNDLDGDGRPEPADVNLPLREPVAADSAITLIQADDSPGRPVVCTVANHRLPGCALDTTLHRSFWLREDAD